jgi:GTP-binding protein EngB required for normal cell division
MSRADTLRSKEVDELQRRITLLGTIVADARGRLNPEVTLRAEQAHELAQARLGHGTSRTVVALAGATGSGKSSLFNAISKTEFATVGIRRPTTSESLAVVFGDGAEDLLNWLEIPHRQRINGNEDLNGLVLVDLPDHDSTEETNRAEVDRLVQVVDLFVWVVDPQKYADAALHENYLQSFAGHGAVSVVVLNQIDRLATDERKACLDDLNRLLAADGLQGVRVVGASATTGEGIEGLRRELSARVAERRAIIRRLDADLDWLANDLAVAVGDGAATKVSDPSRQSLIDAATDAAGGAEIERAVDASYRRRAALAVGWPPVRWVRRAKSDPLARLGLGTKAIEASDASDETVTVRRTAIRTDPVAQGRLGEALRTVAREATKQLPDAPRASIDALVQEAGTALTDGLDVAGGRTDLHVNAARWWTIVGTLQRVVTFAMVVGLAWLTALFFIGWFRLPDPPLPKLLGFPLPTLLAVGGAILGCVLAVIGRQTAAIGAKRRARRARASLADEVTDVIDTTVVTPINDELAVLGELAQRIRQLGR